MNLIGLLDRSKEGLHSGWTNLNMGLPSTIEWYGFAISMRGKSLTIPNQQTSTLIKNPTAIGSGGSHTLGFSPNKD